MKNEWTEAHQREALRRTYEIAAELVGVGRDDDARCLTIRPERAAWSEKGWRVSLFEGRLNGARIDREVHRVRGLAEGWLVRETSERIETRWADPGQPGRSGHATIEEARRVRAACTSPVIVMRTRVTRIRRAVKP
jgi:hypothetical protein